MPYKRIAQILAAYDWQHLTQEEIAAKLEKDMPGILKDDFYLIPRQEDKRGTSGGTNPETNKGEKVPKSHIKAKNKNPRTQFELHTLVYNHSIIREAYDWCLKNLPLKDGSGIRYQVTELDIVTSSQKILDKVNARFGSNFSFNHPIGDLRFFISEKTKNSRPTDSPLQNNIDYADNNVQR